MNHQCGMLNAECGRNDAESCCATAALSIQHSSFSIRPSRRGLTLIELLVTIVIMVTVLAGVLPMISPNNNARKIRESARQLSSLMAQAQAQAARDGRPYGVAFREFSAGGTSLSGMSLEAFTIAQPQPFAGFSEHSRVTVELTSLLYGPGTTAPANGGERFSPQLDGRRICLLTFRASGDLDAFPPRTLKIGDTVEVAGNLFLICDDRDPMTMPNKVEVIGQDDGGEMVEYLLSDPTASAPIPGTELHGIWLNDQGQQLPGIPSPPVGQVYQVRRQPTNTSDAPLQFPRGIGIDLAASGADVIGSTKLESFDSGGRPDVTGIMFSPNGALDAVYFNGTRYEGVEQVFMLMGLFENGNGTYDPADFDFIANPAVAGDNAAMAGRRSRINWLSADSRWVTANRAGRIITSENNTSFDPSSVDALNNLPSDPGDAEREQRRRQINSARQYARQMTGSSGR